MSTYGANVGWPQNMPCCLISLVAHGGLKIHITMTQTIIHLIIYVDLGVI